MSPNSRQTPRAAGSGLRSRAPATKGWTTNLGIGSGGPCAGGAGGGRSPTATGGRREPPMP
eukprot:2242367-Alexandrium_andersonii.AAC.1